MTVGVATHGVDNEHIDDMEKELIHNPEDVDTILTEFTVKSTFDKEKGMDSSTQWAYVL